MLDAQTHRSILRVDGSMRYEGSKSRALTDQIVAELEPTALVVRDLADGMDFVTESWIDANFTAPTDRVPQQEKALSNSDALVDELIEADTLVLGTPIYNFHLPAAVKAWIDQIARVGRTFRYTETGPIGLLEGKRAIVVVTSGGTSLGSEIDFVSDYLRFVLGFIGIKDVTIIDASAGKSVDVAQLLAA